MKLKILQKLTQKSKFNPFLPFHYKFSQSESERAVVSIESAEANFKRIYKMNELNDELLFNQKYETNKKLSEGGQGKIYQIKRISDGQVLCVKTMEFAKVGSKIEDQERQLQVIDLLRHNPHKNIILILDRVYFFNGMYYVIMEQIKEGDLIDYKNHQHVRAWSNAASQYMIEQVISAIIHMHSLGLLHRDIKNENLLVADFQTQYTRETWADKNKLWVKLIDFDFASFMHNKHQTQVGTPQYVAPEQLQHKYHHGGQGDEVDIQAIGVLYFNFITGKQPIEEEDDKMDEAKYFKTLMDKVVQVQDNHARTLITQLLSYESKNREGLDLFYQNKWLSLEGHSLGQKVQFDQYTEKDTKGNLINTDQISTTNQVKDKGINTSEKGEEDAVKELANKSQNSEVNFDNNIDNSSSKHILKTDITHHKGASQNGNKSDISTSSKRK